MDILVAHLAQLILADVLDVAAGAVESEPPIAVDVGHSQGPTGIENVGMTLRDGHQSLGQAGFDRHLPDSATGGFHGTACGERSHRRRPEVDITGSTTQC